jgi:hypothetical protein
MKYGLAKRERTTPYKDTSWYWIILDPEDEDCIDEWTGPMNSLFWWYPSILTKEEVVITMLNKQKQELVEDFLFHWKSYNESLKAFKHQRKNNMNHTIDDMRRINTIKPETLFSKESKKSFKKWMKKNKNASLEDAWNAAIDTMLLMKNNNY